MKQLKSYEEVLARGDAALALYTDGTYFKFNPNGVSIELYLSHDNR